MAPFARPWSDIDALGKLKISKSSYIYVIVVPILSRVFENVNSPFNVNIGGTPFTLDLAFPFTWYTFYFGALCIAVGSAIYTIWCPPMIRLYPNYGAFVASGRDDGFLQSSADRFLDDHAAEAIIAELDKSKPILYETVRNPERSFDGVDQYSSKIKGPNPAYDIARRMAFNEVFDKINIERWLARFFATLFYYLGILAFIIIIVWNAILVVKSLWS